MAYVGIEIYQTEISESPHSFVNVHRFDNRFSSTQAPPFCHIMKPKLGN